MGIDTHTYLGPMARFKRSMVDREELRRGCPKCCTILATQAFCGKCGAPNVDYAVTVKRPVVECDIAATAIDDALFVVRGEGWTDNEWDTFLPNVRYDGVRENTDPLECGSSVFVITEDMRTEDLKAFREAFLGELDILAKLYERQPEIAWGLVVWFS